MDANRVLGEVLILSFKGLQVTRYGVITVLAAHDLDYGPNIDFHSVFEAATGRHHAQGKRSTARAPAFGTGVAAQGSEGFRLLYKALQCYRAPLILPQFHLSRSCAQPVARRPVARDKVSRCQRRHL